MNVAIYHPFGDFPDNYSLSHVVKEQMLMLTEHGHTPHFITSEWFKGEVPEGVAVHAVLPRGSVKDIKRAARKIIRKMDYVLTHDIVYLDSYKKHADALRGISANYIHWIHSAPVENSKRKPVQGTYICMNYADLPLLASQFDIPESQCRVVYNSVSPDVYFEWHPFTAHLVKKYGLLDCDVLITYPLDTGRFSAKGGYKIIKLVEKLRELGKDAKVVFVNAAANTNERRAIAKGLSSEYAIFTSLEEFTDEVFDGNKVYYNYEVVVPRRVVRELFQISNVFPLLSISEGCSLTMLEAALAKNLIVLNEDFPPLTEFGGSVYQTNGFHVGDDAVYMKVSSTRQTTNHNPNENQYFMDYAKFIVERLNRTRMNRFNRKVLKRFNREWIYKHQLEPLLK